MSSAAVVIGALRVKSFQATSVINNQDENPQVPENIHDLGCTEIDSQLQISQTLVSQSTS